MTTTIYYFSGTGNSLFVARQLAAQLNTTDIHSIPQQLAQVNGIEGDSIGIVCPIYMHNLPHIVADFVKTIRRANYLFLVFAGAGELGRGDTRARKHFQSSGLSLSALFNLPMPSNYANYGCPSPDRQNELLQNAHSRLKEIARLVETRTSHYDARHTSTFGSYVFPAILYSLGYPRIPQLDANFSVDDRCNDCQICKKVCPVHNIQMADGKPRWTGRCQQCYACLQWCPKSSIQSGKQTVGVTRYHHPDIKVKDITQSAGYSESPRPQ